MSGSSQRDAGQNGTSPDTTFLANPQACFDSAFKIAGLQNPLFEPAGFIQHLASQNQLLASLRWLGSFQILALIPLCNSISAGEVAELAGVPKAQLCRIVRMTATAGFLFEPQLGQIAHTTLSARFVTDLSFFDAIMFLAESVAPTALQMTAATQRGGQEKDSHNSAYLLAFNTSRPFHSACLEQPRLQRRYAAYCRYACVKSDGFTDLLGRLNWRGLGSQCVVDANAQSADVVSALAKWNSSLQLVIQITDPALRIDDSGGRFTVQRRALAATQTLKDAAVYLLRLTDSPTLREQLLAELNAHLHVLRANSSSTLILALPFLPEPGSVEPEVEATARLWDLSRLQLNNESNLELSDCIELVNSVQDNGGRLVVINKLRSRSSSTAAVGVKYEASLNEFYSISPSLA